MNPGPNQQSVSASNSATENTSQPPVSAQPSKVRYRVAAIGDSLTDKKSHGGQYLDVLRERCPRSTVLGFGKGGNMVNMMRKRFLRDLYAEGPDEQQPKFTHVIILGGLGDILSNETAHRTVQKIGADIRLMVDLARQRGAKAIVLSLPPWGKMNAFNAERGAMTRQVNRWIEAEFKAEQIDGTLDTRSVLSCGDEDIPCEGNAWKDGIHWSEKGQRAVGEALHAKLFHDCE